MNDFRWFPRSKQSGNALQIEWLIPWRSERDGKIFEKELRREVAKGHRLFGQSAKLLGRRDDRDDFLFQLEGDEVAVVHLTWSRETDPAWPATDIFESADAWQQDRMSLDHQEWVTKLGD